MTKKSKEGLDGSLVQIESLLSNYKLGNHWSYSWRNCSSEEILAEQLNAV